ncbi:uncharacterized protein METZ01_LOCUS185942, partial [marine metagenome]
MVTRVDKFLGGLGKDVTNIANVHATENRITFGGLENPSANAHVVGTVLASTNAIVGAEIVTSGHTLDVRGTANVGALTTDGTITSTAAGTPSITSASNFNMSVGGSVVVQQNSGGGGFRVGNLTTAQRVALSAADGEIVYDTSNNELQAYTDGAWAHIGSKAASNLIVGTTTITSGHTFDVRGTANTGAL